MDERARLATQGRFPNYRDGRADVFLPDWYFELVRLRLLDELEAMLEALRSRQ